MPGLLPTGKEIEDLHRKYAPNDAVFDLVWEHCLIVRDVAFQLAQNSKADVDMNLVRTGALLHDIGVYTLFDGKKFGSQKDYITHGIRGEAILRNEGYSERVYRFASHHTGSGLTKEQIIAARLPLPEQDFLAETPEEELVMYADKFHSKTTPPYFNSYEYYKEYSARFGEQASLGFTAFAKKFGRPDLAPLVAKYRHELRCTKNESRPLGPSF